VKNEVGEEEVTCYRTRGRSAHGCESSEHKECDFDFFGGHEFGNNHRHDATPQHVELLLIIKQRGGQGREKMIKVLLGFCNSLMGRVLWVKMAF
jgi:hypothetical protein